MLLTRELVRQIVLEGLGEEGIKLDPSANPPDEIRLIGKGAVIKSVALVALLVGIEQRLNERHAVELSLMDEQAMSQSRSPFRSVGTLTDYIFDRISTSPIP
jgi:hypothetical protein